MNTKTQTCTKENMNNTILKYVNMNDSIVREVIEKERIKEEIKEIRNKVLNSNLEKWQLIQLNALIHRVEMYAFVFKSVDFAKLELEEVKKMLKEVGIIEA
jgi:hypothetical protein